MNKGEFIKTAGRHKPVTQTGSLPFRRLAVGGRSSLKQFPQNSRIEEFRETPPNKIQLKQPLLRLFLPPDLQPNITESNPIQLNQSNNSQKIFDKFPLLPLFQLARTLNSRLCVKKINVSSNFLIHRTPVEWLHSGHIDGAENYRRIAKQI